MLPTFASRKIAQVVVVACFLLTVVVRTRAADLDYEDGEEYKNNWLVELHRDLFQAAQNDPEKLESLLKNAHHHHPYLRNLDSVHNSERSSNENRAYEPRVMIGNAYGGGNCTGNGQGNGNGLRNCTGNNNNGGGGGRNCTGNGQGKGGRGKGKKGGRGNGRGNGNGYGGGNGRQLGNGNGGDGNSKYSKLIMSLFNSAQANLIERVVTPLYNSTNKKKKNIIGVEATTTSTDPTVAANIQKHVSQMKKLLEGGGAIHQFDPLFAAMAQDNADHHLDYEKLANKGVRVQHIGSTPCGVALVQAHAATVSAFIDNGHDEATRTHAVPGACN